MEKINLKLK